jgi:hypothetical protein
MWTRNAAWQGRAALQICTFTGMYVMMTGDRHDLLIGCIIHCSEPGFPVCREQVPIWNMTAQ